MFIFSVVHRIKKWRLKRNRFDIWSEIYTPKQVIKCRFAYLDTLDCDLIVGLIKACILYFGAFHFLKLSYGWPQPETFQQFMFVILIYICYLWVQVATSDIRFVITTYKLSQTHKVRVKKTSTN